MGARQEAWLCLFPGPWFWSADGESAFAPIATTQDAEHSLSSRRRLFSCTLLGARPEVAAEPA